MLARAQPYMLAEKARAIVREEVSKGCRPEIADQPVALEPVYRAIRGREHATNGDSPAHWVPEDPPRRDELVRLQIWISPQQRCDWHRSELFLKQLSCVRRRMALEVIGNRERIALQILCARAEIPVVSSAFLSQFEQCELTVVRDDLLRAVSMAAWGHAVFRDFYPSPPYSHLLTNPDELKRSPYAALMTVLTGFPTSALGFYQVLFVPAEPDHNWHQNVEALTDLEFTVKLIGGLSNPSRFAQQAPSGDLRQMSTDVQVKAHDYKPFFFAAVRIGVLAGQHRADDLLCSLAAVGGMIQHGGRPLCHLTDQDYHACLTAADIRDLFVKGLTYRPGFLLNSWELASLVHIPPYDTMEHHRAAISVLETLPADDSLSCGTPIGICSYADTEQPVCIPPDMRTKHSHLIGRPGSGKSSVMERMILHDLQQNHGAAVLDPHGRLVQRLLRLIPRESVDRVIYLDPGDPDWVPIWNPFCCARELGPGRVADDLVAAFKSFMSGWGDRLEHLLRHAMLAVLHLPQASLRDVANLLRQGSDESKQLRTQVIKALDNENAKLFWQHDFDRYTKADLTPPQHKLSKLLTYGTVSLMLSQSDTSFDFADVMDTGQVLLVDLSAVGPEIRQILGCFVLSLLHLTALARGSATTQQQRPFHIYCDEAHQFLTDAMEDLIAETRKLNVSLTLAHQYMDQFSMRKAGALSSVGSTIIFNVDTKDAQHLKRDLQGLVEADDLITLDVGQAIARIGNRVVRVATQRPLDASADNCQDAIIARSHALYYKPTDVVPRAIRARGEWAQEDVSPYGPHDASDDVRDAEGPPISDSGTKCREAPFDERDFEYDVF